MAGRERSQEGIYFQPGVSPPGFYTILLLEMPEESRIEDVSALLEDLWEMYADLKVGKVSDLKPVIVPSGSLQVLLGYGAAPVDAYIKAGGAGAEVLDADGWGASQFQNPHSRGGGPIMPGCGIHYARELRRQNPANAAFAIQFTAQTPLAVERAVVETWKHLDDERAKGAGPPLAIRAVYEGSQRDDGRSWIDFHDGLSNIPRDEREGTIFIGSPCPEPGAAASPGSEGWPSAGTYMAFIRLRINLDEWRDVGRQWLRQAGRNPHNYPSAEEQIVGRTKVAGCPIVVDPDQDLGPDHDPDKGPGTPDPAFSGPDGFFPDPPREIPGDSQLTSFSHIFRANHLRSGPACDPTNNRIFRQGYPFFETTRGDFDQASPEMQFHVGLNFVSFQNAPVSLQRILTTDGWLAAPPYRAPARRRVPDGRGFGGPWIKPRTGEDDDTGALVTAYAAGMFFVPPWSPGEVFPGQTILLQLRAPDQA